MDEIIQQLARLSQSVQGPFRSIAGAIEPQLPDYLRQPAMPNITPSTPLGKVGPGENSIVEILAGLGADLAGPPGAKGAAAVSIPIFKAGKQLLSSPTETALKQIDKLQTKEIQRLLTDIKSVLDRDAAKLSKMSPEDKALKELDSIARELGIALPPEFFSPSGMPTSALAKAKAIDPNQMGFVKQGAFNEAVGAKPPKTIDLSAVDLTKILNPQPSKFVRPDWYIPEHARAAGFQTPAFHGTNAPVNYSEFMFSPFDIGAHFGSPKAAYDRMLATSMKSHMAAMQPGEVGPRMYPAVLQTGKQLDLPDLGSWMSSDMFKGLQGTGKFRTSDLEAANRGGLQGYRDLLTAKGYDSIRYVNQMEDPGSISHIMFRPAINSPEKVAGIRSPFASFQDLESSNIMASLAALGLIGIPAAGMMKQNAQQQSQ